MIHRKFLSYLVEQFLPGGKEWKEDKEAQYVCLAMLVLFLFVIAGGLAMFNLV